jgi:hypothetical protein
MYKIYTLNKTSYFFTRKRVALPHRENYGLGQRTNYNFFRWDQKIIKCIVVGEESTEVEHKV